MTKVAGGFNRKEQRTRVRKAEASIRGMRLVFTTALLLGGLFSAVTVEAQQVATKVARIGYLALRQQFVEVRRPKELDRAFSAMTKARAGALTVVQSNMFFNNECAV